MWCGSEVQYQVLSYRLGLGGLEAGEGGGLCNRGAECSPRQKVGYGWYS